MSTGVKGNFDCLNVHNYLYSDTGMLFIELSCSLETLKMFSKKLRFVVFFLFSLKHQMEMQVIWMKAAVLHRAPRPPEFVPQRCVLWTCFFPDRIVECAVSEQLLASHLGCVMRTAIRSTNLELAVYMSIHPVVSCSQSNQGLSLIMMAWSVMPNQFLLFVEMKSEKCVDRILGLL